MPQLNVPINGRTYLMACDPGEEDHLKALAARLDFKIAEMRVRFGEIGDGRLTIMAALTLADEASEAERRAKALETELATLKTDTLAPAGISDSDCDALAARLDQLARRIQTAAQTLTPEKDGSA